MPRYPSIERVRAGLSRARPFAGAVIVGTLVALSLRAFVLEPYRIKSDSMAPSLVAGNIVVAFKSSYAVRLPGSTHELIRFHPPLRGDVVVITVPGRGKTTHVKRVVAIEGDRVELRQGKVLVNGEELRYEKISPGKSPYASRDGAAVAWESSLNGARYQILTSEAIDYGPIDVPPGHFFALGDNRVESVDSRAWGPLPYSCLAGKLALVWASLRRGDDHG